MLAAIVALGAARVARAQELYGTLRSGAEAQPVAGAVVMVTRVADQSIVARGITGARGSYRVTVGTDSVVVRVLRIGLQPEIIGELKLHTGEQRELSAVLVALPVTISAIDTRVSSRCRVRPDGATAVAQLFAQARTALIASRLTGVEGVPLSAYAVRVEQLDTRERPLGEPTVSYHSRATFRPFESVAVEVLAAEGFRTVDRDGTTTYRAPDADIVTADRFLSDYCLSLVVGEGDRSAWIGVGFEPAQLRRDIIQVRGTLWIDRASNELRQLEYSYLGLEPILRRVNLGGFVAYTRLENGVWFVHEWAIRMPMLTHVLRSGGFRGGALPHTSVSGIQVTSGQVLEIQHERELLYTAGERSPLDSLMGLTASLSALGERTPCLDSADRARAVISGVLRDVSGQPLASALVRAEWRHAYRSAAGTIESTEMRDVFAYSAADGTFELCGVPRDQVFSIRAAIGTRELARTAVRIRRDNPGAFVELRAGR